MEEAVIQRINRAKYLLSQPLNAALATVNIDGTPHNTPVLLIHDQQLTSLYWASHPDSLHSQNVARTGQIFVVLYEATVGGGLYIKAEAAHELAAGELEASLQIYNAMRQNQAKTVVSISSYKAPNPQRMYGAQPTNFYINSAQRDTNGAILQDRRIEIPVNDLID